MGIIKISSKTAKLLYCTRTKTIRQKAELFLACIC